MFLNECQDEVSEKPECLILTMTFIELYKPCSGESINDCIRQCFIIGIPYKAWPV